MKINHFPEDTDYDHDSAEYLLRTWGSESEWGGVLGLGRGPERGEGTGEQPLDRHAGMNLPANPNPDAEILWTPIRSVIPRPPPPLTLGRAEGRSWEVIGLRAVPGSRQHCSVTGCRFLGWDWPLRPGLWGNLRRGLATLASWLGKPVVRLVATPRTRQILNYDWLRPPRGSEIAKSLCWGSGGWVERTAERQTDRQTDTHKRSPEQ